MRVYNTTLNPDIWSNENEIKPDIRIKLLQIASDFYKDSKLPIPIKDVVLIGSNANYNWTTTSDLDVHILINTVDLHMAPENIKPYLNLISNKWNKEHDIHIKNYNVELYIQDTSKKNTATGIYSLLNNMWKMKPQKQNVVLDKELIKQKYQDIVLRIKSSLKEKNLESMKNTLKDIYDLRQSGLDRAGEFSTENVVFKLLRNKNYLDSLRNEINRLYDKQISIN
jgi:muramidase (phage lysozyme)